MTKAPFKDTYYDSKLNISLKEESILILDTKPEFDKTLRDVSEGGVLEDTSSSAFDSFYPENKKFGEISNPHVSSLRERDKVNNVQFESYKHIELNDSEKGYGALHPIKEKRFLVNTPTCKIPYFDPYDESIADIVNDDSEIFGCPPRVLLTYSISNELFINKTAINMPPYNGEIRFCTYRALYRPKNRPTYNNFVKLLDESKPFNVSITVKHDFIIVFCYNKYNKAKYINVHTFIPKYKQLDSVFQTKFINHVVEDNITEHLNVIILGMDSVSRLAFIRHMKNTKQYLEETLGALNMMGYNKVADNTFPNVVPLTIGKFVSELSRSTSESFDKFDFIWKLFSHKGYRTFYSEDDIYTSIFDLLKPGFKIPPTEYFDRPLMLILEQYRHLWFNGNCFMDKLPIQITLDYLYKFLDTYRRKHFFAFQWSSKLTHGHINHAKAADDYYHYFLKRIYNAGILNNTILFLLSDHGQRSGRIRQRKIGRYEDRLPVMFLYVPKWLRNKYPYLEESLQINKHRLSSPFDVNETLKNILNFGQQQKKNESFSRGISLFQPIPFNRTCESASVSVHWCTCPERYPLSVHHPSVTRSGRSLVKRINHMLQAVHGLCETYNLHKIDEAELLIDSNETGDTATSSNKNRMDYTNTDIDHVNLLQIVITTTPGGAKFEATVKYDAGGGDYKVVGDISRINIYGGESECIGDFELRKFCLCRNYHFRKSL